eukprot:5445694-Alexandrium_andersonii.AAC.1
MSASLVGSEMCIRDRALPSPPQSPPEDPQHFFAIPSRSYLAERLHVASVSYTHLTLPTICSV